MRKGNDMEKDQDERVTELIRLYEQCDERGRNDILICAEAAADMTKKFAVNDLKNGEEQ